jgi:hypothetical protein
LTARPILAISAIEFEHEFAPTIRACSGKVEAGFRKDHAPPPSMIPEKWKPVSGRIMLHQNVKKIAGDIA